MNAKTTIAAISVILLGGCSLVNQDGIDNKTRHFTIPTYNSASENPPYTRVMGMPMADMAWVRERASECEPWMMGKNGCMKDAGAGNSQSTAATEPSAAYAAPHKRKKPYRGS